MFVTEVLPKAKKYIQEKGRDVESNIENWDYFEKSWKDYIAGRKIDQGEKPIFPEKYDVKERDQYYKKISFAGWGGSSGHDAPMIAFVLFLFFIFFFFFHFFIFFFFLSQALYQNCE